MVAKFSISTASFSRMKHVGSKNEVCEWFQVNKFNDSEYDNDICVSPTISFLCWQLKKKKIIQKNYLGTLPNTVRLKSWKIIQTVIRKHVNIRTKKPVVSRSRRSDYGRSLNDFSLQKNEWNEKCLLVNLQSVWDEHVDTLQIRIFI